MDTLGLLPGQSVEREFPYFVSPLLLGKGGSGAVYLAEHCETKELVAVKRCYTKKDATAVSTHALRKPFVRAPDVILNNSMYAQCLHEGSMTRAVEPPGTAPCIETFQRPTIGCIPTAVPNNSTTECSSTDPGDRPHNIATCIQRLADVGIRPGASEGCISTTCFLRSEEVATFPAHVDEATLLQCIGPHPHIVKFLGSYTSPHRIRFMAMELMHSDVSRELREGNCNLMQEHVCTVIIYSVLEALCHIHDRGIVHRDVKPGNILLKRVCADEREELCIVNAGNAETRSPLSRDVGWVQEGSALTGHRVTEPCAIGCHYIPDMTMAFLGDFSAAHFVDQLGDTAARVARGTLYYKAPEQLMGRPIEDYRACDMWALGCTMFEICSGTVAFSGSSELQVQLHILHKLGSSFLEFPAQTRTATLVDGVAATPLFQDLLRHLLELDPLKRYSARDALQHPLFRSLRMKRERWSTDIVPASNSKRLCFPLNIAYAHTPDVSSLQIHFKAVDVTPRQQRQREARQASTRTRSANAFLPKNASAADVGVPVASEEDGGRGSGEGCSFTESRCNISYSTVSEVGSLHWSQCRPTTLDPFIGAERREGLPCPPSIPLCRDGRSISNTQRDVGQGNRSGDGIEHRGASCEHRLSGRCCRSLTSISPVNTVARSLNMSDISGVQMSEERRHVGRGELAQMPEPVALPPPSFYCRPPVLTLASGATFTPSNMRTHVAYEAQWRQPECCGPLNGGPVRQRSFSSCSQCSTAPCACESGVGRALLFSEEKYQASTMNEECGNFSHSPSPSARKMLKFESPRQMANRSSGVGETSVDSVRVTFAAESRQNATALSASTSHHNCSLALLTDYSTPSVPYCITSRCSTVSDSSGTSSSTPVHVRRTLPSAQGRIMMGGLPPPPKPILLSQAAGHAMCSPDVLTRTTTNLSPVLSVDLTPTAQDRSNESVGEVFREVNSNIMTASKMWTVRSSQKSSVDKDFLGRCPVENGRCDSLSGVRGPHCNDPARTSQRHCTPSTERQSTNSAYDLAAHVRLPGGDGGALFPGTDGLGISSTTKRARVEKGV